jgi:hypothetical protein
MGGILTLQNVSSLLNSLLSPNEEGEMGYHVHMILLYKQTFLYFIKQFVYMQFRVLTVLLKIQVFCDVMLCHWVSSLHFGSQA